MSSLERQKKLYIIETLKEILELQFKTTGKTDPELMKQFQEEVKEYYNPEVK
jgi:hypothetical protein